MWISAVTFAEVLGRSERQARRILSDGKINGVSFTTRSTSQSGGIRREAWIPSLPSYLQQRLRDQNADTIDLNTLRIDERGLAEHNWKLSIIRPILAHPWGSSERRAAIRQLVGKVVLGWDGKPWPLKETTLELWIRTYEENDGLHLCLAKKVRKDKGKARVVIRKEWDNAVPFDAATCAAIRHEIKQYLRGLIKAGGTKKKVLELTSDKLRDITARHGGNPDAMPAEAFVIPLDFYREELHFRKVYRHKKDRKASHDAKPRIQRTTENLKPMDVVVMDVHHINVLIARENGKTATAKMIAFHDIATSRVFCEIIMFEKKGGVRNADIITAFINMCMDPNFGLPKVLYVDNGSEYGWADDLQDALKLNIEINGLDFSSDRSAVVRAIPYNASAKQVEGWFRQMNQQYFRHIPGWIDDDRMNPKRESLGKPMPPYPGTFDQFVDDVKNLVEKSYGWSRQYGGLNGRAPLEKFQEFRDGGWKATLVAPDDLLSVFTRPKSYKITKGGFKAFKRLWTCDEIISKTDEWVTVHIPKYHGFEKLRITDGKGKVIGFAHADTPFDVLDQRGAKESARRTGIYNRGISDLGKSVPDIDMMAELLAYGERRGDVIPNTPDAVVSVNGLGGKGLARLPVPAPAGKTPEQEQDEARMIDEARRAAFAPHERKVS